MADRLTTQCCVTGGGPAGIMLGFLLARAGVDVIVLEKHADFFRDFRGDTIHPSTLQLMHELGLLQRFLALPHQQARWMTMDVAGTRFSVDFSHLPTVCKYVALMPQWDFLNFIADCGKRYPGFRLLMQTEATAPVRTNGKVTGVHATQPAGDIEISADLVVGADGRHSTLRPASGLVVEDLGAPIDVLWIRLPRLDGDPEQPGLVARPNRLLVTLNRGDYFQCAYLIPKGGYDALKQQGFDAFRKALAGIVPFDPKRVDALSGWDDVRLLTVAVDRLTKWWTPGLLFIGDAAHALAPIGGVGVNLAVQDAVAAANILAGPLAAGMVTDRHLAEVEHRRTFPMRATQRMQIMIQNELIGPLLSDEGSAHAPLPLRIMSRLPVLQRLVGRAIGLGFRPEHIHTPDVALAKTA